MSAIEDRPLLRDDETISRAHWYFSFEKEDQQITFAIPRQVQATVALCACKALLSDWRYIDRDDPTYGSTGSDEEIDRWRSDFLTAMRGTHLAASSRLTLVVDREVSSQY